jgi:PAS domain S-box-containing protein
MSKVHGTIHEAAGAVDTAWSGMKRYVQFDDADAERLRRAAPLVSPRFAELAERFYDRTREHDEAHAVFVDEAQIERLKRSLVAWLTRVFSGPHDDAYFARTNHIGEVHSRIGLPARYMVLGMSVLRDALFEALNEACLDARLEREARVEPEELPELVRSVARVLDLELTVMLESYATARRDLERIQAEAASYASASHELVELRTALGHVDVLVIGLDREGRIRFLNAEVERITGHARAVLLGRTMTHELVPEGLIDELEAAISRVTSNGTGRLTLDGSGVRTRSGRVREVRWQLVRAEPLPEPSQHDVAIYLLGRDITEERELGERIRRAERLATVGTLAAGLAHEIRNPLHGAQLHLTFLERQLVGHALDDRDVDEALVVVRREILRLSKLVTEFLDFAKPHPLDRRDVDVREVCQEVASLVGPEAELAGVELALDLPRSVLTALVDPAKLSQVVVNLVRNAIEATSTQGSGTVVIRARRKPRSILVEVEDDGPGLGDATLPIFDPFFTTKATGSGLGLSIAHRIVVDHEGSLSFESKPGQTVFRIQLPVSWAVDHGAGSETVT